MPNIRVQNLSPNVRRRNDIPTSIVSSFQSGIRSIISPGTPIGLLLVLTYASQINAGYYSEFRPNIRIANN